MKQVLTALFYSFEALVKVLLLSKWNAKLPKSVNQNIIYLANGPSVPDNLDRLISENPNSDFMVSNFFYKSDLFLKIMPKYYIVCDPSLGFEGVKKSNLFKSFYLELFDIVTWPIILFVPFSLKRDFFKIQQYLDLKNDSITIVFYNSVNFSISNRLIFKLFDFNLGMPSPRNVAVAALTVSIQMGFKKISILGVDYSMHKNLAVNENNELEIRDEHFYSQYSNNKTRRIYKDFAKGIPMTMKDIFYEYFVVMRSFEIIKDYANFKQVEIKNYSPKSFVDQFQKV